MRFLTAVVCAILAAAGAVIVLYRGEASQATSLESLPVLTRAEAVAGDDVTLPASFNRSGRLVESPEAPENSQYPATKNVIVVFDDGTQIPVQLRRPKVVNPPYVQEGRLLDQYQALVDAAEAGDAAAARMLYVELKACMKYRRVMNRKTPLSEEMVESMRALGLRCEGVSEELLETRKHWVRLAAEGGDYLARQSWAFELGKTVEAFRVMEAFWLDGNASALPLMSHLAQQGISADSAGGEPDYVRAYAYNLIYLKLELAARARGEPWKPGASPRLDRYIAYEERLKQIGGFLSPQQQAAAEKLAIQMVSMNKHCCTGSF
jgi:hypothetical protein